MQQELVAAIPRALSRAHLAEDSETFDFELRPHEMQRVHGLARGERPIDPMWAPAWDGGIRPGRAQGV